MKALKEEIELWEKNLEHAKAGRPALINVDGPLGKGSPLCDKYFKPDKGSGNLMRCFGCPVFAYTGTESCLRTPWMAVWAAKTTAERAIPWVMDANESETDRSLAASRVCRLLVEQTERMLNLLKRIEKKMEEHND